MSFARSAMGNRSVTRIEPSALTKCDSRCDTLFGAVSFTLSYGSKFLYRRKIQGHLCPNSRASPQRVSQRFRQCYTYRAFEILAAVDANAAVGDDGIGTGVAGGVCSGANAWSHGPKFLIDDWPTVE